MHRISLIVVSSAALLAACGGLQRPIGTSYALPQSRPIATNAERGASFLYVASDRLSKYSIDSSTPRRSVKTEYAGAAKIALDSHGDLCESNGQPSDEQIYAFNARTLRLERTLNGEGYFAALVTDRSGYLYATNGAEILVYAPGCTQQVTTIGHCASGALPLVFDQSGNLYAGNYNAVCVYAPTKKPGRMQFVRAINHGINNPVALAVGPTGDLFVANVGGPSVSIFPSGSSNPDLKITDGINRPMAMAVDSKGRLYVASQPRLARGWVSVYTPNTTRPLRKIGNSAHFFPDSLAIDASDDLYVGTPSAVDVYTPGGAKLVRKITRGVEHTEALLIGSP